MIKIKTHKQRSLHRSRRLRKKLMIGAFTTSALRITFSADYGLNNAQRVGIYKTINNLHPGLSMGSLIKSASDDAVLWLHGPAHFMTLEVIQGVLAFLHQRFGDKIKGCKFIPESYLY